MADKQSRGVYGTKLHGYKVVDGEPSVMYVGNPKNIGNLSVKLDIDVSEALTGLKALQREAKEATKALRELESERIAERLARLESDPSPAIPWRDIKRT